MKLGQFLRASSFNLHPQPLNPNKPSSSAFDRSIASFCAPFSCWHLGDRELCLVCHPGKCAGCTYKSHARKGVFVDGDVLYGIYWWSIFCARIVWSPISWYLVFFVMIFHTCLECLCCSWTLQNWNLQELWTRLFSQRRAVRTKRMVRD